MKSILSTPMYTNPYDYRAEPEDHENDQPERSRMVDGEEYITVSEFVHRLDPFQYPQVAELVSASGYDRTYIVLGMMAAKEGRFMRVDPAPMYHPEYEQVNGWPIRIIDAAWHRFQMRYNITWLDRDPEPFVAPTPLPMPSTPISQGLMNQIRGAVQRRGIEVPFTRDPRWRGAYYVLLEERKDESPQQALVRRNSAAAAMCAIEMEYERR